MVERTVNFLAVAANSIQAHATPTPEKTVENDGQVLQYAQVDLKG